MKLCDYYDYLIDAGNDPFRDGRVLREYMDKWDGDTFLGVVGIPSDARLYEKNVLEIGVGSGRIAARVLPRCKHLTGIDLSPKAVARASENLEKFDSKTLVCGDFLDFEFAERFDIVYSTLTFWHIEEKQRAVSKVFALLNAGGKFVLSISKDTREIIEFSENISVRLYPDTPAGTSKFLVNAAFGNIQRLETEFACIFSAEKGAGN